MNKKLFYPLALLAALTSLLAACNAPAATPTVDPVQAVHTAAAATVQAKATKDALNASPTPQPSNTPEPTHTATPATPTNTPAASPTTGSNIPVQGGCNNSQFVTDVTINDNTVVKPGDTFVKTWRVKNTGTCVWSGEYKIVFVSGNPLGADTTKIVTTVQPGATFDVSVTMKVPTNVSGTVTGFWQLATETGQRFGTSLSVIVNVNTTPGPSATATATATATNTPSSGGPTEPPTETPQATYTPLPTYTPYPTNTAYPTDTPVPSATPTATPTATATATPG